MRHSRSILVACAVALAGCAKGDRRADSTPATAASTPFTSDRISVTTRGAEQGQDIVLVHGLAGHPDVWAAVADSLSPTYRLHLVSIAGMGGAAAGANADGPVVVPVAEEIARYIATLPRRHAAVVGHSMGGAIAMMVAERRPESVDHLMVVDEPPAMAVVFPGVRPDSLEHLADGMRTQILNAPAGTLGPFEQMLPTMSKTASARPLLIQYAHASNRPTIANAFRELIVADLRPDLGRITAPTTVLYAVPPQVPMSPAEFDKAQQQTFSAVRGVRVVRVDSTAHYIQIDRPDRVVAEVRALMAR